MSVVKLDISQLAMDLDKAGEMTERSVDDLLLQVGNSMAAEMRQRAPVKTGNLRDSIGVKVDRRGRVEVGPDLRQAPYAWYVEYGTKPHVIKAKKAKALRFEVTGKTVYAKKVNHPGTKPQPYVRPTIHHWVDLLSTEAGRVAVRQILSPK